MTNSAARAATSEPAAGDDDPIEIPAVHEAAPWWPYGIDGTYRLVRRGDLRAIAIGRRRFVTRALLRECLTRHTVSVSA